MQTYMQKGYSKDWINQRLKTIEIRKELTDEWERIGIEKQSDYAILTNEITKAWSGKSIKDYKKYKGLKKENLRDNMNNLELVLNMLKFKKIKRPKIERMQFLSMLAEVTTKEISEKENPKTFEESKDIAKEGEKTAKLAKENIEKRLGEKVVSSKNSNEIHFDNKKLIEEGE